MQPSIFASKLLKTITILACGAFIALHAFAADDAKPAKEKPANPKTSGGSIIYYAYPGAETKPQSQVATIIVENNLHLSLSGKTRELWRKGGTAGKLSLSAWEFIDVEPGAYEVSATFATKKKSSKDPIVWRQEFKADTIYYASYKTSLNIVFNSIPLGKNQWSCNITDNVVPKARERVIAARNQDIETSKTAQAEASRFLSGELGAPLATVPIPQGLNSTDVGACVVAAMKARQWEVLTTTDSSATARHPNGKTMCYLHVKYNETSADIHGQNVSKNWSEGYKGVLAKQLKTKAGATGKK